MKPTSGQASLGGLGVDDKPDLHSCHNLVRLCDCAVGRHEQRGSPPRCTLYSSGVLSERAGKPIPEHANQLLPLLWLCRGSDRQPLAGQAEVQLGLGFRVQGLV